MQAPGQLITRRTFAMRAVALAGALTVGRLLDGDRAFAQPLAQTLDQPPQTLDPSRTAVLAALVAAIRAPGAPSLRGVIPAVGLAVSPAVPATPARAAGRFAQIYSKWDIGFQTAAVATLDALQSAPPSGTFTGLSQPQRIAFLQTYATSTVPPFSFGSAAAFHDYVSYEAQQVQEIALLDLQTEVNQGIPGALEQLTQLPAPASDLLQQLITELQNLTSLLVPVPYDDGQLPPDDTPIPPGTVTLPPPPAPLSADDQLREVVRAGIMLAELPFTYTADLPGSTLIPPKDASGIVPPTGP